MCPWAWVVCSVRRSRIHSLFISISLQAWADVRRNQTWTCNVSTDGDCGYTSKSCSALSEPDTSRAGTLSAACLPVRGQRSGAVQHQGVMPWTLHCFPLTWAACHHRCQHRRCLYTSLPFLGRLGRLRTSCIAAPYVMVSKSQCDRSRTMTSNGSERSILAFPLRRDSYGLRICWASFPMN